MNVARGALDNDNGEVGTYRDPVYLSKEELRLIHDRVASRYRLFVWTLTASDLRFSEAATLRKRDLQLMDDGWVVIHVRRAWQKSGTGHVVIGPRSITAGAWYPSTWNSPGIGRARPVTSAPAAWSSPIPWRRSAAIARAWGDAPPCNLRRLAPSMGHLPQAVPSFFFAPQRGLSSIGCIPRGVLHRVFRHKEGPHQIGEGPGAK